MNVRIMKCESNEYWYANRIGEVIEVEQDSRHPNDFGVVNPKKFINDEHTVGLRIEKEDCQIVDGEYPYIKHDFDDLNKRLESMGINIHKMERTLMKDGKEHIILRGVYSPKTKEEK